MGGVGALFNKRSTSDASDMNILILAFKLKSPALHIHPSAQEEKWGLVFGKATYDSPAFLLLAVLCLFQRTMSSVLFSTNGFCPPKIQKLLPPVMHQDNQDRNYGEDSNIPLNADLQRGGRNPCPKPNTGPSLPGQVTHVSQ